MIIIPAVHGYFVINSLSSTNPTSFDVTNILQSSEYYSNIGYTETDFYLFTSNELIDFPKNDPNDYKFAYTEGQYPIVVNDLATQNLFALQEGNGEYLYNLEGPGVLTALRATNPNNYSVNQLILLSEPISLGFGSAIFSGMGVILIADGDTHTVYSINTSNGTVTMEETSSLIRWQPSQAFASQGIAETNTSSFSLVYGNLDGNIERQSLLDNSCSTVSNLEFDLLSSITVDIQRQKWWYYYSGTGPFNNVSSANTTLGFADFTYETNPNGIPEFSIIETSSTSTTATLSYAFGSLLPYGGTVYCAAYTYLNKTTPSSASIISTGAFRSFATFQTTGNVTITGLSPLTLYYTYCTLIINNQNSYSEADIAQTQQIIETKCCKVFTYANQPVFIYSNPNYYTVIQDVASLYTYTFSLSAAPQNEVVVAPLIYNLVGMTPISSSVIEPVPVQFLFTNSSFSYSGSFTLKAHVFNQTSSFQLVLKPIGGKSASQYEPLQANITLLNSSTIPFPPNLMEAYLGDSGSDMYLTFDSPTNSGGYAYQQTFPCSKMFNFTGSNLTSCYWLNATVVRGVFSRVNSSYLVNVKDPITILANRIKLQCSIVSPWLLPSCQSLPFSRGQTVPLKAPYHPVVPALVLLAPSEIASCTDLLLDATASSGDGNRPLIKAEWSVYTLNGNGNIPQMQALLNSFGVDVFRVYTIPRGDLGIGSYTISLSVTNFLFQSTVSSIAVTAGNNDFVPEVTIPNGNIVSILAYQSLTVFSTALFPGCSSLYSKSRLSITFDWQLFSNTQTPLVSANSINSDPSIYELPAYSLTAGKVYTLQLTVSTVLDHSTILASVSPSLVTIVVNYGIVEAIVLGGSSRGIPYNQDLTLDGSHSKDQDLPVGNNTFSYFWNCTISSYTAYSTGCNHIFAPSTATVGMFHSQVTVIGRFIEPNYTYLVTFLIQTLDGSRDQTSVTIFYAGENDAFTEIMIINKKFNVNSNLTIDGVATANTSVSLSWSAFTSDRNVTLVSYTPLNLLLPVDYVNRPFVFPLVVKAYSFAPGMSITFRFTAVTTHVGNNAEPYTSSSSILLQGNGPPHNGIITVSPTIGNALITNYSLIALHWVDDPSDYPLLYTFFYELQPTSVSLTLQPLSPTSSVTTVLPPGLQSLQYIILLFVEVYDNYNAYNNASTTAQVLSSSVPNQQLSNYIAQNLHTGFASANSQLVLSTINNGATVLNVVNCSSVSASYCASLHRSICSSTPQKCDGCLTGYKGIVGPSNTPCYPNNYYNIGEPGSSCQNNSNCLYGNCVSKVCLYPILTCPSSFVNATCSGHGNCGYYNPAGVPYLHPCLINNAYCFAQCSCMNGYGGNDCSLNVSQLNGVNNIRATLCSAITQLHNMTSPAAHNVGSLINSLNSVYSPEEVTIDSAEANCKQSLQIITNLVSEGYLVGGKSSAINYLVDTVSNYIKPAANGKYSYLDEEIKKIIPGILLTLKNGQVAVQVPSSNVRLSVQKQLIQNLKNGVLLAPSTPAMSQYGASLSSLQLVGEAAAGCDSGSGYSHYSMMQYGINPLPNASKVISPILQFSGIFSSNTIGNSNVIYSTLNHSVEFYLNETVYYVVLQFITKEPVNQSTGSYADQTTVVGGPKRANTTFPVCRLYNGVEFVPCGNCNISSYTSENVTFKCKDVSNLCKVTHSTSSSSNRRLFVEEDAINDDRQRVWNNYLHYLYQQSIHTNEEEMRRIGISGRRILTGDDDYFADDSTSAGSGLSADEYGALLESATLYFESVISSNPFDINIEQAKVILSFISSLIVMFLVGALFFVAWDSFDKSQFIYGNSWPPKSITSIHLERWVQRLELFGILKIRSKAVISAEEEEEDDDDNDATDPSFINSFRNSFRSFSSIRSYSTSQQQRRRTIKKSKTKSKSAAEGQDAEYYYSKRKSNKYLFSSNVNEFFNLIIPDFFYYRKWIALSKAILYRHDYTSVFFSPFGETSRFMRWMDLFNNILNGLFISTVFFGTFYANTGRCESYLTEKQCLEPINSITGLSMCLWKPATDQDDSIGSCALSPPPANLSFVVILALTCVLIGAPLQIGISFLLDAYCSQLPVLEDIGLSTEYWFGRGVQTEEIAVEEKPYHSELLENITKIAAANDYFDGKASYLTLKRVHSNLSQCDGSGGGGRMSRFQQNPTNAAIAQVMDQEKLEQLSRAVCDAFSTEEELKRCLELAHQHYQIDTNSLLTYLGKAEVDQWLLYHNATTTQIVRFIGLQSDGHVRSLSLLERIVYSSLINKMKTKLSKAREKSERFCDEMKEIQAIHAQLPEVYLLYQFILEQLHPFKKWIMKEQLLCFQGFFPSTVPFFAWISAWSVVFLIYCFYFYWIFDWGVTNGSLLLSQWGLNFAIGAIQDIFFVSIVKIVIFYIIALISIKPQLIEIKQFLKTLAISLGRQEAKRRQQQEESKWFFPPSFSPATAAAVDNNPIASSRKQQLQQQLFEKQHERRQTDSMKTTTNSSPPSSASSFSNFEIVHHLSPTCRVAWRHQFQHLFMSRLLRLVDDYDILQLQRSADKHTGLAGVLIIFVPITLTLLGAFVAEFLLDILLPLFSTGLIIGDYYLYTISVDAIIIIWIVIIGLCIWYYGIVKKASRFMVTSERRTTLTMIMPPAIGLASPSSSSSSSRLKSWKELSSKWTVNVAASSGWNSIQRRFSIFLVRQRTKQPNLFREMMIGLKHLAIKIVPYVARLDPQYHQLANDLASTKEENLWRSMNLPLPLHGKTQSEIEETTSDAFFIHEANKAAKKNNAELMKQSMYSSFDHLEVRDDAADVFYADFDDNSSDGSDNVIIPASVQALRVGTIRLLQTGASPGDRHRSFSQQRQKDDNGITRGYVLQMYNNHDNPNTEEKGRGGVAGDEFEEKQEEEKMDIDDNKNYLPLFPNSPISFNYQKLRGHSDSPLERFSPTNRKGIKEIIIEMESTKYYFPPASNSTSPINHNNSPTRNLMNPLPSPRTSVKKVKLQYSPPTDYLQQLVTEQYLNYYPWDDYLFYQQYQQVQRNHLSPTFTPYDRRPGNTLTHQYKQHRFLTTNTTTILHHMLFLYLEQQLPEKSYEEYQEMATTIMIQGWNILILKKELLELFAHIWDLYYPKNYQHYLTISERKELIENLQSFLLQNYFLSSKYINFYYFTEWFLEMHQQIFYK